VCALCTPRGAAERCRAQQRASRAKQARAAEQRLQARACREACDWARRRRAAALQGGFVAQSLLHVCTDFGSKSDNTNGGRGKVVGMGKEMVLSADKLRKKEKERIKTGKIRKVFAAFSRE